MKYFFVIIKTINVDQHKGKNVFVTGYGKLEEARINENQTLSQIDLEIHPAE